MELQLNFLQLEIQLLLYNSYIQSISQVFFVIFVL